MEISRETLPVFYIHPPATSHERLWGIAIVEETLERLGWRYNSNGGRLPERGCRLTSAGNVAETMLVLSGYCCRLSLAFESCLEIELDVRADGAALAVQCARLVLRIDQSRPAFVANAFPAIGVAVPPLDRPNEDMPVFYGDPPRRRQVNRPDTVSVAEQAAGGNLPDAINVPQDKAPSIEDALLTLRQRKLILD